MDLKILQGIVQIHSSGSRQKPLAGFCEHGIESYGYIKCGEFRDKVRFLKSDHVTWS